MGGDGAPEPLGVTLTATGVNVAVASSTAEAVEFCLFDANGAALQRMALAARVVPVGVLAKIAEKVFGPLLCARIAGLALVTFITRGFFLFSERPMPFPAWLRRGLKVAPLAALTAVVVPEIVMSHGRLITDWHDARLPAVAAATLCYVFRPGVLGPLLAGLAVFLPLHLFFGW